VAIAVYLMDYAFCRDLESITLFAGDRDFISAIDYAKNILGKEVTIVAFEESLANRIRNSGVRFILVAEYLHLLKREKALME